MAYSMTGFGRGQAEDQTRRVTVELKSVNNRYCDLQIRLPQVLYALEPQLRRQLQQSVSRGKLDVVVTLEDQSAGRAQVLCDRDLARAYLTAYEELAQTLAPGQAYAAPLKEIAARPEVLTVRRQDQDAAAWAPLLTQAVTEALRQLTEMRRREGAHLTADLAVKIRHLEQLLCQVRSRAPEVVTAYRGKLAARVQELLGQEAAAAVFDQGRLAQEVLLFADKAAVDEEEVRLESHLQALDRTLKTDAAVGKKLDFLVQELNREMNTIGSKANDLEMTRLVVEMKTELERIREQIQNLE
ncbi:MAG: YicC family protein [Oscillospiraceae bacterium]|nr:YicC family protein [Oscillospiraceae bacterium]MDD4368319.1 YicC family protein [Oscillospiraceae bacterium]